MKIGLYLVILNSLKFEEALDYVASLGLQTVELGAGAYAGTVHCDPEALLASDRKTKDLLQAISSRGLQISALNVAGNPIHPNRQIAAAHDADFRKCIRLAQKLDVEVVINFSGCPGGAPGDQQPNWATCPWPPDYLDI